MGALITFIGGLIIVVSGGFSLLILDNGGVPALVGALPVTGPVFLGGLVLAAFGGMLSCLLDIRKASMRQTEILEALALRQRSSTDGSGSI